MTIKLTASDVNKICNEISDNQIKKISNCVMFVGHAHSGHSLIGALLDSHSKTAISNHLNIPNLLNKHKLTKAQLYKIILYFSLKNNDKNGWINTGYNYQINSGFQGRVLNPILVGDKQGGASTRIILKNPELVNRMIDLIGDELKIIFVYRNELDNIAAYAHYMKEELSIKHVRRYFENLETVFSIKKVIKVENWFQINHESFISDPPQQIKVFFDFLGLTYNSNQINNICEIVKQSPNKRRKQIKWNDELLKIINTQMKLLTS